MATDYFNLMRDVVGSYGKGVTIARDRQYEDEKRAREKTLQERDDATYARTQDDRANVDKALKSFQATQGGIYDGRQARFDTPMPEGEMGPQMQSAMPNPAAGLTPRAPTKLETNQGLAGIAMAQRDVNAMGTLAQQAGVLRVDQKFADAMKSYKEDPGQVSPTARFLNKSSGRITMGKPDKNGLISMSIVDDDQEAEFLKLSRQDQAQLYAAGTIMDDDPARALEIMGRVNKTLAAAIAAENGLTKFLADNSNDVSAKGDSMANDKTRLGLEQQRVGIAAGAARDARNKPQWVAMEDGQGGVRYVDMNAVPSKGGIAVLPEGTRPARKPVDQKDVIDAAAKMVESGMPDPDEPSKPLTMQKAMVVAGAQLSERPYVTAQDKLTQAFIDAKNGGKPTTTGGLKDTRNEPTPPPVDVLKGRIIGPLTSLRDIEQSALAGNLRAQQYLAGREANRLAPRSTSDMLNQ